jgi:hypothetical protein
MLNILQKFLTRLSSIMWCIIVINFMQNFIQHPDYENLPIFSFVVQFS